jgi:hypothetical protein
MTNVLNLFFIFSLKLIGRLSFVVKKRKPEIKKNVGTAISPMINANI